MKKLVLICAILLACTLPCNGQTQHDRIKARGASTFDQLSNTTTITITGATPSVVNGNVFKTNNGGLITITNFLGGVDTQQITIICGDTNTTIQNNANIFITGGVNFTCSLNTALTFVFNSTAGIWSEEGGNGSGGGSTPGAPTNSLQKNSGIGTFVASAETSDGTTLVINEDSQIKGPNPWADVRAFGKFDTASSTTATTTSGSPTVTLAAASNFKNNEYATIYNAGATCGLSTPGTPTVTASVNGGGTRTVAGQVGSSNFAYSVVAADKFGCFTPASVAGTTATGNTLGLQAFSISTMSRANNVVTVNTTATHSFTVGQMVHIKYFTTSDASFEGFWMVASVPTGTSFTFVQGMDTRQGATTSATSGTVQGFNANLVTWAAVPGAWKYYIYGRTGGVFALLGQTLLSNWVDYGSPMNDNQTFPAFIPTTAPVTGANDHLTAKIISGGGTTSLTLAANAGATLTALVQSDDGPALVAAANAAATIYVPSQGITINSYTQLPANRVFKLNGRVQTNDTIENGSGTTWESFGTNPPNSFSWSGAITIIGNSAYPQMVLGATNTFNRVAFVCGASNGCLNTVDSQDATNISFDYTQFVSTSGSLTDYLGMNQLFKGGGFGFRYNKCLFTTGTPGPNDNTNIGNSPIPSVVVLPRPADGTGTGNFAIYSSWATNRGSFGIHTGTNGINYHIIKDLEMQSLVMPVFQLINTTGGSLPTAIDIQNMAGADRATAYIAAYGIGGYSLVTLANVTANTGGHGILTGLAFGNIVATTVANLGQNTNYLYLAGGNPTGVAAVTDGVIQASSMGFGMPAAAAPGVVVSAGGGVVIGTFPYVIQFLDANGNFGPVTPPTFATTSSGNQTVTITRPAPPVGAVSWVPYLNGARIPCFPLATSATNYVHTLGFQCGQTTLPVTALSNGIGAAGVGATTVALWNNGFTSQTTFPSNLTANRTISYPDASGTLCITAACTVNSITLGGDVALTSSPRSFPPIFFPGALTTTWTATSWTIDRAITVTRVQSAVKIAGVSCGTSPIVQLTDGTTAVNLTLNAALNDSGVISQNYAAGVTLTLSVQTAASGCTTSPGDANVTVQYRMQ